MPTPTTRLAAFTNGDLRFPARDDGPLDGEPVLLLHGWPQDGDSWDNVVALLHAAGFRTFAPSLRGRADTARPKRRSAYTLPKLRADVRAMVEQIGQPVHLVGHDWGAALAWSIATHEPDLLRTLTAVSVPHPASFLKSMVTSRQGWKSWYMYFFQLPVLPELAISRPAVLGQALRQSGLTARQATRDAERNASYAGARGGLNWYRGAALAPFDGGRPTPVPVLQIWSDGDIAVTDVGIHRTHEHAAGDYRLVTFEGVSHWIPDEVPERLAGELVAHFTA